MKHRIILLGADTQIGLTVARELADHGVEVIALVRSNRSLGRFSRSIKVALRRKREPKELVTQLLECARRHDVRVITTVSEDDIQLLNSLRSELAGIDLLVPDTRRMNVVLDKQLMLEHAKAVGIHTPESHQFRSIEELERVAPGLRYPVVLKWNPIPGLAARLGALGLPLFKSAYAYSTDELVAVFDRYRPAGLFPLVQSFCPGYGIGHMVVMVRGEAVLRFQHRRIHEWPPEGGTSTLCESVALTENRELFDRSVALLRRIEWEGPAMVEYRFDAETGDATFMEVNGRYWGSIALASHAGAHFAWTTYSSFVLGVIPMQPNYQVGLKCAFAFPEMRRLYTVLFRQDAIQNRALRFDRGREFLDDLRYLADPRLRYYVFDWKDPLPFVMDCALAVQDIVKGIAR